MASDEIDSLGKYRHSLSVSVVIPAYNEAANLPIVIGDLQHLAAMAHDDTPIDIIVCDNGSSDATAEVARSLGVRVVTEPQTGYGAACLCAMSVLEQSEIVVFVDADQRVLAEEWHALINAIRRGADLAVGCRVASEAGAMTPQQQWGNRFATVLIRSLFGFPVTDLGPFRAIRRAALLQLDMQDRAYGWTVEMQLKALLADLHVVEVPVTARRRLHGHSKVSGTLRGTIGAGVGIIGTIIKSTGWSMLRRRQTH